MFGRCFINKWQFSFSFSESNSLVGAKSAHVAPIDDVTRKIDGFDACGDDTGSAAAI